VRKKVRVRVRVRWWVRKKVQVWEKGTAGGYGVEYVAVDTVWSEQDHVQMHSHTNLLSLCSCTVVP